MWKTISIPILIVSFFLAMAIIGKASSTTKVFVDPARIVNTGLGVGDTFIVYIKISDVTDMGGYDIKLSYDTTVLDITGNVHTYPSGFSQLKNEVDEDAGTYWVAAADFFGTSSFSGSTSLATLTFTITDDGWSNLDIYETSIPDKNNNPIPHDVEDGYFSNVEYISITLIGYPVEFSNFDPGTTNNPAPTSYTIRVDTETSVNVDIYHKGEDFTSNGYSFDIENMKWNDVDETGTASSITETYSEIVTNVPYDTDTIMYYWISLPSGQRAGDYETTLYVKGVNTGNPP